MLSTVFSVFLYLDIFSVVKQMFLAENLKFLPKRNGLSLAMKKRMLFFLCKHNKLYTVENNVIG